MNSKSPGSVLKIGVVEGDDCIGLAIDGGLQDHLVVGVRQLRPPEKVGVSWVVRPVANPEEQQRVDAARDGVFLDAQGRPLRQQAQVGAYQRVPLT